MSRINQLLRSSLESHTETLDGLFGRAMEDYMDFRSAMEEYRDVTDAQAKVSELSESLIEIEGLVDESRNDGDLSEDQVQLQVDAVNVVREVIDGDVAEISIESFDSLMSVSLHASSESQGMLSKLWEAFLAMLRSIKEAFLKAWRWLSGSNRRAKDAAKVVASASKVAASKPSAVSGEKTQRARNVAAKVDEASRGVSTVVRSAEELVKIAVTEERILEGVEVIMSDSDRAEFDAVLASLRNVAEFSNNAAATGNSGGVTPNARPDQDLDYVHGVLVRYAVDADRVSDTLVTINKFIDSIEKLARSPKIQAGDLGDRFRQAMQSLVNRAQSIRTVLMDYLRAGDQLSLAATSASKEVMVLAA